MSTYDRGFDAGYEQACGDFGATSAALSAQALREAARELDTTDHATETALQGVDHVIDWLRDRADRLCAEAAR